MASFDKPSPRLHQAVHDIVIGVMTKAMSITDAAAYLQSVAWRNYGTVDAIPNLTQMVYDLLDSNGTALGPPVFDDEGQICFARTVYEVARQVGQYKTETSVALTTVLSAKKQFSEAITILEELVRHLYTRNDLEALALVLNNLGGVYMDDDQIDLAQDRFLKSLELAPYAPYPSVQSNALKNLAMVSYRLGIREQPRDQARAQQLFQQGFEAATKSGYEKYVLYNGRALAELELQIGDVQIAIARLQQLLRLVQGAQHADACLEILNNLGVAYRMKGELREAKKVFLEAAQKAEMLDNRKALIGILGNLGDVAQSNGDAFRARDYLQRATEIARSLGERGLLARVLVNLGNASWTMDDLRGAESSWSEAVEILITNGDSEPLDGVAKSLDRLLRSTFRPGLADELRDRIVARFGSKASGASVTDAEMHLEHLQARIQQAEQQGNQEWLVKALLELAGHYKLSGVVEEYLSILERAGEATEEMGELEQSWRIWSELGDEYKHRHSDVRAFEFYRRAIVTLERIMWSATAQQYIRRPSEAQRPYEGFIESAIRLGEYEQALIVCDWTKCQTEREEKSDDSVTQEHHSAFESYVSPFDSVSLEQILDRVNGLTKHVVIDLKVTEGGLVVFVVPSPDVAFRPDSSLANIPERRWVDRSGRLVAFLFPQVDRSRLNEWDALGFVMTAVNPLDGIKDIRWSDGIVGVCRDVYVTLLGSIVDDLRSAGVERITIIPDGYLHRLPFHLANRLVEKHICFLIDDFEVSVSPSWKTVRARRKYRSLDEHRFLLIACDTVGDLPWIHEEIQAISNILSTQVRAEQITLLDHGVTIERLCSQMREHTVLHLACHGHFSIMEPSKSGLILENGILTCEQIAAQRLPVDTQVVLSTCKGMLTDAKLVVESHNSPAAAFLRAGAHSVIASLVEVDDMAAFTLMEATYATFVRTYQDDLCSAMRSAALDIRRGAILPKAQTPGNIREVIPPGRDRLDSSREEFQSPKSWGSFAVFGNCTSSPLSMEK